MKKSSYIVSALGLLGSFAFAGTGPVITQGAPPTVSNGFANIRRPITNPTLFDMAVPTTNLHPIYIYQGLPSSVSTAGLGDLPVDGSFDVYALQFEYALNDRFSIVAAKDGYIHLDPDHTLSHENGWANLAAGVKYAFILDPNAGRAVSGTATVEVPTGNSDVFQGDGGGDINLILSGLQLVDEWQFAGSLGLQVPFSNNNAIMLWSSAHVSYELCRYFIPVVEMSWFHVLHTGNGAGNFHDQVGGAVPSVVNFEGGDLLNLGATNAGTNRDFVSMGFGFRSRLTDCISVGAAYEIPLTAKKSGLMDNRVTADVVWTF